MPGTHTFYDGSIVLQPIADAIGLEVDKVSVWILLNFCLPLIHSLFTNYLVMEVEKKTKIDEGYNSRTYPFLHE